MTKTLITEFLGVFPAEASVKSDPVVGDFGVFKTNAPGARASREQGYASLAVGPGGGIPSSPMVFVAM